jgi:nicotinamide riboside kinase
VKIAFMGSHGVGKTTLCYDLAGILKKHVPRVDIVKEVARACPLPINRDTTLAAQSWILHTQIASEIAAEAQHDAVICDRGALDNYAYLVAARGGHPILDELVSYWMTTYDYLFKVPIGLELETDGIRDTGEKFQREIDECVDRLLNEKNLSYYRLPSRNRSSWMNYIQRIIDLPKSKPRRAKGIGARQMSLPIPR